jgi:methylmalonyl-CoA/ethylmalonyl-CoA epimerase
MTDQITLDTIGQIHVTVTDIDESVAFYRDVLGMKFLFQVPDQDMAFFDCGGVRLYLGVPEGMERKSSATIYYRVDDIQATWKSLTDKGVKVLSKPHMITRMDDHELWMGFFNDPADNIVAIMSELPLSS